MKRSLLYSAATMLAVTGAIASPAGANVRNSIQPAHVYFGDVQSGNHPNKVVTLHNGTGARETISQIAISGSGGYVFTIAANTPQLAATGLPRCKVGTILAPGARCAIDVRVHTLRSGWFRSVLRVLSTRGNFNSAELRVHVTPAPKLADGRQTPPACGSLGSASITCNP